MNQGLICQAHIEIKEHLPPKLILLRKVNLNLKNILDLNDRMIDSEGQLNRVNLFTLYGNWSFFLKT